MPDEWVQEARRATVMQGWAEATSQEERQAAAAAQYAALTPSEEEHRSSASQPQGLRDDDELSIGEGRIRARTEEVSSSTEVQLDLV